ncbi:MAG: hypothetical protein HY608_09790 [Planctomycetes bacterium]|nr:hypothetical protein [Planctomycetota bacterium]
MTVLRLAALPLLLAALLTSCGGAPVAEPPAFDPAWTASPYELLLTVEGGADPVGGYLIEIRFDPARIRVTQVGGGADAGFGDAPASDRSAYDTGRVRLAAVRSEESVQAGTVRVARVQFSPVPGAAGEGAVEASLLDCADAEGRRIVGAGVGTSTAAFRLGDPG